jgi:hypothetical protein
MSKTIPYVRDLRTTAATIAAQHIAAGLPGGSCAVPIDKIEAALDAAEPFLVDAYLIEGAMAVANEQASSDPHVYLKELQRRDELNLRTFELEGEAVDL